jgi:hypothetical protein
MVIFIIFMVMIRSDDSLDMDKYELDLKKYKEDLSTIPNLAEQIHTEQIYCSQISGPNNNSLEARYSYDQLAECEQLSNIIISQDITGNYHLGK